MSSAFFRRVGKKLEKNNCRVSRINLCIGDWIFWNGKDSYNFRGKISDWKEFIENFLNTNKVTHIILVGEQRKYHNTAIQSAKKIGVNIIVTDFGYLRPDWIAMERDGMNGTSLIPQNINDILSINKNLPETDLCTTYSDSEFNMISRDVVYSFSNLIDFIFFPHYIRSDNRPNPAKGFFFSLIKWIKLLYYYNKTKRFTNYIESGNLNFFLYAMQLEHDFQIVKYSQYDNLIEPLKEIIESYAKNCSRDVSLIIKNHPCDLGIRKWEKIIKKIAKEYNVENFIYFVDGGTSLDKFLKHSKGLITVNSTSGLRALQLDCPVKTLSQAVYNINGMTYQGKLDDFWKNMTKPLSKNIDAFINVLALKYHIRGVFFKEPGMSNGIYEFTNKLINDDVGI